MVRQQSSEVVNGRVPGDYATPVHVGGKGVLASGVPEKRYGRELALSVRRPNWDDYFLNIAVTVAQRADCTRRKVGAVIVKDQRIVSTGYNGASSGQPGCLTDGACPRGQHWQNGHRCGGCKDLWPCDKSVQPSSSYDTGAGSCIAVHAEANALIYADYEKCQEATLYCTDAPCDGCRKLVNAAGISRIVVPERTWSLDGTAVRE